MSSACAAGAAADCRNSVTDEHQHVSAFLQWLEPHLSTSMHSSLMIRTCKLAGRGLFLQNPQKLKNSEPLVLFAVATEGCLMATSKAYATHAASLDNTAIDSLLKRVREQSPDDFLHLVLRVMYELQRGKHSPYAPWLRLLPLSPTFDTLPFLWPARERSNWLQGIGNMGVDVDRRGERATAYEDENELSMASLADAHPYSYKCVRKMYETSVIPVVRSLPHLFPDNMAPAAMLKLFHHATAIVMSRAVRNSNTLMLVPMVDFANARASDKSVTADIVTFDNGACGLQLRGGKDEMSTNAACPAPHESGGAGVDDGKNEWCEITITYGPSLCNVDLLMRYGFIDSENPRKGLYISAKTVASVGEAVCGPLAVSVSSDSSGSDNSVGTDNGGCTSKRVVHLLAHVVDWLHGSGNYLFLSSTDAAASSVAQGEQPVKKRRRVGKGGASGPYAMECTCAREYSHVSVESRGIFCALAVYARSFVDLEHTIDSGQWSTTQSAQSYANAVDGLVARLWSMLLRKVDVCSDVLDIYENGSNSGAADMAIMSRLSLARALRLEQHSVIEQLLAAKGSELETNIKV